MSDKIDSMFDEPRLTDAEEGGPAVIEVRGAVPGCGGGGEEGEGGGSKDGLHDVDRAQS